MEKRWMLEYYIWNNKTINYASTNAQQPLLPGGNDKREVLFEQHMPQRKNAGLIETEWNWTTEILPSLAPVELLSMEVFGGDMVESRKHNWKQSNMRQKKFY